MIDLELLLPETMPEVTSVQADQLLNITREVLSNVARHSGASRAELELAVRDGTLTLVIGDNGRGFDTTAARSDGHRGLANLKSRAETMGGSLEVNSERRAGTRVVASVPLGAHNTARRRVKVIANVD